MNRVSLTESGKVREGAERQSAGDLLRSMRINPVPADLIQEVEVPGSRKQLSGTNIFSFCPYCVQRSLRASGKWRGEVAPMQTVLYKRLYAIGGGQGRVAVEREYECTVCKVLGSGKRRRITERDFSAFYGDDAPRHEGQKFIDLSDARALERAGFAAAGLS